MSVALAFAETAMSQVKQAVSTPYPPSFDNNPMTFGWALFARLTVFFMSIMTLVRIHGANKAARIPANHPVFYHRTTICCFLWGAIMSSSSDVMTDLVWNEASDGLTSAVFMIARMLEGLTIFPFLGALFVHIWLRWLCTIGFIKVSPSITLSGMVTDVRVIWPSFNTPVRMLIYCASTAIIVTTFKYTLWLQHGHP